MSEYRPSIGQIVRQSGENVRVSSEIVVLIRVSYKQNGPQMSGFYNGTSPVMWRINQELHRDIAKFLLNWLKSAFPEWEIGKPQVRLPE